MESQASTECVLENLAQNKDASLLRVGMVFVLQDVIRDMLSSIDTDQEIHMDNVSLRFQTSQDNIFDLKHIHRKKYNEAGDDCSRRSLLRLVNVIFKLFDETLTFTDDSLRVLQSLRTLLDNDATPHHRLWTTNCLNAILNSVLYNHKHVLILSESRLKTVESKSIVGLHESATMNTIYQTVKIYKINNDILFCRTKNNK